MKIVIIVESIDVNDSSGSKVNVALIHSLHEAGFQVVVYHYSHKEIQLSGIQCELIKEKKISPWYVLTRLQRWQVRATGWNINPFLEFIMGFSFSHTSDTRSIYSVLKKKDWTKVDFILTLSKGGSFRPHRALLRLKHLHAKWIAYIHDPYPFHFYPRPYNWVEAAHSRKQKLMQSVIDNAYRIAFPSLLLRDWMASYFPGIGSKSLIIPHQINHTATPVINYPDYFEKDQFNLLHAGNLLGYRNPRYLIEAVLNILQRRPEIIPDLRLLLIGPHEHFSKYLTQFSSHSNIVIRGNTDYQMIQAMESASSVNIILEAVSEISPFLPGKFPNCIVAKKPILLLGPYYSESRRLLGFDYPYWSEANDTTRIEKHIETLYERWNSGIHSLIERPELIKYLGPVHLRSEFNLLTNKLIENGTEN